MNKSKFLLAIVIIILITAITLRIRDFFNNNDEPIITDNSINIEEELEEVEPEIINEEVEFKIKIIEPSQGEIIESPLLVKGLIISDNLIEKDLYLVLISESDIVVVEKIEIEESWIIENRVPFSNILKFSEIADFGHISVREKINNQLLSIENFEDIFINIK